MFSYWISPFLPLLTNTTHKHTQTGALAACATFRRHEEILLCSWSQVGLTEEGCFGAADTSDLSGRVCHSGGVDTLSFWEDRTPKPSPQNLHLNRWNVEQTWSELEQKRELHWEKTLFSFFLYLGRSLFSQALDHKTVIRFCACVCRTPNHRWKCGFCRSTELALRGRPAGQSGWRSPCELPMDSGWWAEPAKLQGHRPSTPASGLGAGDQMIQWAPVQSWQL